MTYLVLVIGAAALAWPWWWLSRRRPEWAVAAIFALVVFSAHVFAALYRIGVPADVVRGLIPLKDFLAVVLAAVLVMRLVGNRGFTLPSRTVVGAVAVAAVAVVAGALLSLGDGGPEIIVRVGRGLALPIVAVIVGLTLTKTERTRAFAASAVVILVGVIAAFVELALPIEFLTRTLNVGEYWREVKAVPQFLINHDIGALPGNTFVEAWRPESTRRLAGPFGDSLSAGYVIAVGILMALAGLRRWWWAALTVVPMLAGLLLTFTRGGWIIVAAVVAALLISAPVSRRLRAFMLVAGVVAMAVVVSVGPVHEYLSGVLSGRHGSTLAHLEYLDNLSELQFSLWGDGYPAAGAIAGFSTENVVATSLLQMGLVLGIAYWLATLTLAVAAMARWQNILVWAAYVAALAVSWTVSEQWLTYNAGWPMAFLLGAGVVIWHKRRPGDDPASDAAETQGSNDEMSSATAAV